MEFITDFLTTLNSLSPLAVIALLGVVIFMLVQNKDMTVSKLTKIETNDLHELPDMSESLKRIETLLQSMNDNVIYIRARVNGRP